MGPEWSPNDLWRVSSNTSTHHAIDRSLSSTGSHTANQSLYLCRTPPVRATFSARGWGGDGSGEGTCEGLPVVTSEEVGGLTSRVIVSGSRQWRYRGPGSGPDCDSYTSPFRRVS